MRRARLGDERGVTMVELLVTTALGMIVILGVLAVTEVAMRSSAKTATRVAADQRARPVLERLVDQLHSTCIGPEAGPLLAGSTESSLSFLHQTGSTVTPLPDKVVVSLSGSTLTETVYPSTGGQAPNWTFAGTPSSSRVLMTGVGPAQIGDPPIDAPLFRYFKYDGGVVDPNSLPTPLSAANSAIAVRVDVAFSVAPLSDPTRDDKAPVTVSDSVLVRFSPASEDPTKVNGPCV
jgi:ABC-type Fe3+-hydroxamate transport system substrate-binding protein